MYILSQYHSYRVIDFYEFLLFSRVDFYQTKTLQ